MIHNTKYSIRIGWLYPELMSTYGDRGNIIVLSKRCEWRGIEIEVVSLNEGFSVSLLGKCDFLFMGGAQDKQQKIVSEDLSKEKKRVLKKMVENGIPGLYICGAYQFLGRYYKESNGKIIRGLGILDLYTEHPGERSERLIGNIVVKTQDLIHPWGVKLSSPQGWNSIDTLVVGFENHGGRTYLGKGIKPFGQVLKGFGNNGMDKTEGVVYKNSFGTYLHGPILSKNPEFADYLIKLILEKKYEKVTKLRPIDSSLEEKARKSVLQKMTFSD